MSTFPDISSWYTPERIAIEEPIWAECRAENAQRIESLCTEFSLQTIIECGCGTGWIPFSLNPSLSYVAGIDKNPYMLARAQMKNPTLRFIQADLRNASHIGLSADLVCSFAVLKHFSLLEWTSCLKSILAMGRFGLFTQHVLPNGSHSTDHGLEYHNIWPTESEVCEAIESAGHEILSWDATHIDEGVGQPEVYITTRRKS